MLDELYFDVTRGGVHSEISIWVKDGLVYHKARLFGGYPDPFLNEKEPYPASTEWLMRLHRLHIFDLESHYRSDTPEDVVWLLRGVYDGKPFESDGVGRYFQGWDDFLLLVDELAPEAEFIDPYLIEHLLMVYEDIEDTDFGPSEYKEELSLDRRSQKLIYKRSFSDDVYAQTEYRNGNEVSFGLDMWDRFFENFPALSVEEDNLAAPSLNVFLDRHDGTGERMVWTYNRTCLPENWPQFIGMVGHRLNLAAMFTNMIKPCVYQHGAREGEHILCRVKFENEGTSFYYKTKDNSLQRGDKVLVPVGPEDELTSGEITKVEYFTDENLPAPLSDLKEIYGRDFDAEKEIKK